MTKSFAIPMETMVVTSTYVTQNKMPILQVTREMDEDGGELWQFHCGNGDFDMQRLRLVRLGTVLRIDPAINDVADLPIGFTATRSSRTAPWVYTREQSL